MQVVYRYAVEAYFIHGLSRDELDGVLRAVFQRCDADGSGYLDHRWGRWIYFSPRCF